MKTNNKMREALTQIEAITSARCAWDIATIAKTALAEPVKNCEVGNANEQADRFGEYCTKHHCWDDDCPKCKLRLAANCELAWAQMPYTEGGAK